MKIRIKGNSIRIRLSKSEVDHFAAGNFFHDSTNFGNSSLGYSLQTTAESNLKACFLQNQITVFIPEHLVASWANTNLVGLDHHMPLDNNETLYILVEKDFRCIDEDTTEDQSDYFENPAKSC